MDCCAKKRSIDMKTLKRLMANFVDIFVFLAIVVMFFLFILPYFLLVIGWYGEISVSIVLTVLILIVSLNFAVQYPFLRSHQTIGKTFFGLKIISTNEQRLLTLSVILQREIFAKIMTCYIMCLPVLLNKRGKHDEACETDVV